MPEQNPLVSFEDEPLILVDRDDRAVGYAKKRACHDGDGLLHRAFSVFLRSGDGRVLLQQRSLEKRLWPGYWSNACCSHPRRGESLELAVERRLREELGTRAEVSFLFDFVYHARFADLGSEHELCHVFIGEAKGELLVNRTEIADIKWLTASELDRELTDNPDAYTPWLKLEWRRIRAEHEGALAGHG